MEDFTRIRRPNFTFEMHKAIDNTEFTFLEIISIAIDEISGRYQFIGPDF